MKISKLPIIALAASTILAPTLSRAATLTCQVGAQKAYTYDKAEQIKISHDNGTAKVTFTTKDTDSKKTADHELFFSTPVACEVVDSHS